MQKCELNLMGSKLSRLQKRELKRCQQQQSRLQRRRPRLRPQRPRRPQRPVQKCELKRCQHQQMLVTVDIIQDFLENIRAHSSRRTTTGEFDLSFLVGMAPEEQRAALHNLTVIKDSKSNNAGVWPTATHTIWWNRRRISAS